MQTGILRLFCTLAETGSFTRAADLNYVTQSAITQMLHGLERDAGHPLATRRPFKLTLTGHYYHQYGREILRLFARLEQALQSAGDAVTGIHRAGRLPQHRPAPVAARAGPVSTGSSPGRNPRPLRLH